MATSTTVVCPRCERSARMETIRRHADEFCPDCDYPLFWAPTAITLTEGSESSDDTLRRLPGAGGRRTIGTLVCPTCGELNPIDGRFCIRDGSPLRPEPEAVVVIAAEPDPPPPPPPLEPEPRSWWWLWVVLTAIVGVIGVVLLFLAL
jgi:hypothetical protein